MEEEKKIKNLGVVPKSVNTKNKKIFNTDFKAVMESVTERIIIPGIKNCISGAIKGAVDMIFGNGNSSSTTTTSKPVDRVSYVGYYDKTTTSSLLSNKPDVFDNLIFNTSEDATRVLNGIRETLSEFHVMSVADLYELVGLKSDYTDNKYGWTSINSARIEPSNNGFVLILPKPSLIK